jgi:hypothetical protein
MLVFNKYAVDAFPVACSLVALQMLFTSAAMIVCCWSSIHIGSMRDVMRWCMVVPFFSGMLLTSILSLKFASMTLVVTFRALAPVLALVVERFYPNPLRVSSGMMVSIFAMMLGVAIYTSRMESSEFQGVGWVLLNNLCAIGDRLLQRLMLGQDQRPVDISKTGLTLLNNLLGVFPLIAVAIWTQEIQEIPGAFASLDLLGCVWVVGSCVVCVGISYCGIWAQSLISATSFLVLVNANKFAIIALEAFTGAKALTMTQQMGATVSILGAMCYGWSRQETEKKDKEQLPLQMAKDGSSNEEEREPLVQKK